MTPLVKNVGFLICTFHSIRGPSPPHFYHLSERGGTTLDLPKRMERCNNISLSSAGKGYLETKNGKYVLSVLVNTCWLNESVNR